LNATPRISAAASPANLASPACGRYPAAPISHFCAMALSQSATRLTAAALEAPVAELERLLAEVESDWAQVEAGIKAGEPHAA